MADEPQASEAPAQSAKGGGGSGMLPALLVIVLMPVISFAMFKFLFIPMIKAEIPEPGEHEAIKPEDLEISYDDTGEEYSVEFDDVVTNVKGTNQTRFVQVKFTIYSINPELQAEVDKNKPRLKDRAIDILGNLTLADLERREMKNTVRNLLKESFNHVLGKPMVEEISFSQFVVQ